MGTHASLTLTDAERHQLGKLVRASGTSIEVHRRARILLAWAQGGTPPTYAAVAEAVGCHRNTVGHVCRRAAASGVDAALYDRPLPPRHDLRKVTGEVEAKLIALACSAPPQGYARWSLRLLADRSVELVEGGLSPTTVSEALKKTRSSRGG